MTYKTDVEEALPSPQAGTKITFYLVHETPRTWNKYQDDVLGRLPTFFTLIAQM